jgi:uridine kinase
VYDITRDRATGTRQVQLDGHRRVIAEGVFAAEIVAACRSAGILGDAITVVRAPWKNFARRLARDLREARKPPATLLRRGRLLLRQESALVAHQVACGCRPLPAREADAALAASG